jgi:hypothetical protein
MKSYYGTAITKVAVVTCSECLESYPHHHTQFPEVGFNIIVPTVLLCAQRTSTDTEEDCEVESNVSKIRNLHLKIRNAIQDIEESKG